jgi:uncharacterized protein (TIGR02444 family)
MSATDTKTSLPIWDFVLIYYRQPGFSETAIMLQDSAGIDVNMILFLMWVAAQKRSLSAAEVKAIGEKSHAWQRNVVVPLRGVRRLLKENAPLVEAAAAQDYRKKVQALEIEGEQLQLNAMAGLLAGVPTQPTPTAEAAARASLAAFESLQPKKFPETAIETFVRALEGAINAR